MRYLSLDLSTTCTGWAEVIDEKLTGHGIIKPKVKSIGKLKYPWSGLAKIGSLATAVVELIELKWPDVVYIEEVNKGKNRIGQKALDALHYEILRQIKQKDILQNKQIKFIDSDGNSGWRTTLDLKLSPEDKKHNRQHKGKENLKFRINKKDLACRYVNKRWGLSLDVKEKTSDGDLADAIGILTAVLLKEKNVDDSLRTKKTKIKPPKPKRR